MSDSISFSRYNLPHANAKDAQDKWRQFQPMGRTAVNDAAYTILATDSIVAYTNLTAGRTATLPAANSVPVGKLFAVVDEGGDGATHNLTVDGNGAETISGAASVVIAVNYGYWVGYSNGSAWFTVSQKIA